MEHHSHYFDESGSHSKVQCPNVHLCKEVHRGGLRLWGPLQIWTHLSAQPLKQTNRYTRRDTLGSLDNSELGKEDTVSPYNFIFPCTEYSKQNTEFFP